LNACFFDIVENVNNKAFDVEKLQNCYDSKFKNPKDKFNTTSDFLRDLEIKTNYYGENYDIVPSMFIDSNLVRGKLEVHSAMSALCDSMKTKLPFCLNLHRVLKKEIEDNYLVE